MDIENIKALLSERHMTFEDLAKKMGKERSVVYKTISNGNPTLAFLLKLSEVLGISIDDIVSSNRSPMDVEPKNKSVDGFVEIDGDIYRIKSVDDLERILSSVKD